MENIISEYWYIILIGIMALSFIFKKKSRASDDRPPANGGSAHRKAVPKTEIEAVNKLMNRFKARVYVEKGCFNGPMDLSNCEIIIENKHEGDLNFYGKKGKGDSPQKIMANSDRRHQNCEQKKARIESSLNIINKKLDALYNELASETRFEERVRLQNTIDEEEQIRDQFEAKIGRIEADCLD